MSNETNRTLAKEVEDVDEQREPTIKRLNVWDHSDEMLGLWSRTKYSLRQHGDLRSLTLRQTRDDYVALAVSAELLDVPDHQSTEERKQPQHSFMHFLPNFLVRENIYATNIVSLPTPWLSPKCAGLRGFLEESADVQVLLVTFEQPTQVLTTTGRMSKRKKERFHVERYLTDFALIHYTVPFHFFRNGDDPPDFICETAEGAIRLECTQFTTTERRQAHGLFTRIRQAILEASLVDRAAFAHLTGQIVYFGFQGDGTTDLPPRSSDVETIREVVEAIKNYHPDPAKLQVQGDEVPEQAPKFDLLNLASGATIWSMPIWAAPLTAFYMTTGLEMAFAFPTLHDPASVWGRIVEMIAAKDRDTADELLITVGGPNEDGHVFPSEGLIADLAFSIEQNPPVTRHLKKVTLHFWETGRIVEVVPTISHIQGDIYSAGMIPGHQALDRQSHR